MNSFVIPGLGLLCAFMGITFLVGCFVKVDSSSFITRAAGDQGKIAKLHSLQAAWDRLGRFRQFVASSSGYLIMAAGLLLIWYDARLAKYFWLVPVLYAVNLLALLRVRHHAVLSLDKESAGHAEVLRVIKQNIRICVTFSIIYVLLATRA